MSLCNSAAIFFSNGFLSSHPKTTNSDTQQEVHSLSLSLIWSASWHGDYVTTTITSTVPTVPAFRSHVHGREVLCGWSCTVWLVLTVICVSTQDSGQWPGSADLSHAIQCRPGREEHPAVRRVAHPGRNSGPESPFAVITCVMFHSTRLRSLSLVIASLAILLLMPR